MVKHFPSETLATGPGTQTGREEGGRERGGGGGGREGGRNGNGDGEGGGREYINTFNVKAVHSSTSMSCQARKQAGHSSLGSRLPTPHLHSHGG